MPGTVVAAGSGVQLHEVADAVRRAARSDCAVEPLFGVPGSLAVVWAAPAGYPKHEVHTPLGFALLEGTLPGLPAAEIHAQLSGLIAALHEGSDAGYAEVVHWAGQAQGDFVVTVATAAGELAVASDALGRLPFFVREQGERVTLAREVKFAVAVGGPGRPDTRTMSQMLLLGYPLARGTIVEGIAGLPPGGSLLIRPRTGQVHSRHCREWNFEQGLRPVTRRSGSDLAERFASACAMQGAISGFDRNVVALSGGLDSRAVAGGMVRAGHSFSAVTFNTQEGDFDSDVPLAREVAAIAGAPWRLYRLDPPSVDEILGVVRLRDGLNPISLAPSIQYLSAMRRDFGESAAVFSGDGGDKVLPDIRPPWWVDTLDRNVEFRLGQAVWPSRDVAQLLGIPAAAPAEDLRDRFRAYPERNAAFRDVHFLIEERGWGWLLEGEDRNRSFFWQQTPFYDRNFFEAAMRMHPNGKRGYALYAAFLRALDPRLAALANAKWSARAGSIAARSHEWRSRLSAQFPPQARGAWRRMHGSQAQKILNRRLLGGAVGLLLERALSTDCVTQTFSGAPLRQMLQQCTNAQFTILATLILYVADTWGKVAYEPV